MTKERKLDELFLDLAERISEMSFARRLKVGALVVQDGNIVSMGWNGTPSGMDNNCELENADGSLSTRPEVLHAESNALMKLAASGSSGAAGATLYTTYSPCPECAKLIKQAKVARVVYRHHYRLPEGVDMLQRLGVQCDRLTASDPTLDVARKVAEANRQFDLAELSEKLKGIPDESGGPQIPKQRQKHWWGSYSSTSEGVFKCVHCKHIGMEPLPEGYCDGKE